MTTKKNYEKPSLQVEMKKILFTLMLLLGGLTAAWAGEGYGTKNLPYSGEWQVYNLASKLKVGDYLAYDCVLLNGSVTVYDSKLDNKVVVVSKQPEWNVGKAISENPSDDYKTYCSLNKIEVRKQQLFQISKVERDPNHPTKVTITGCYNGKYTPDDTPLFEDLIAHVDSTNKVCVYNATQLADAVLKYRQCPDTVIQIMNDIDMSSYSTPAWYWYADNNFHKVDFHAQLCGYYQKTDTAGNFILDKDGKPEVFSFTLSHLKEPLFNVCHGAKVRGLTLVDTDMSATLTMKGSLICNGAYDNTEFTDITIVGSRFEDSFLKQMPYGVGSIINFVTGSNAGLLASKMEKCTVQGVDIIGSTLYIVGSGVGSIVGYAKETTFKNCSADAGCSVFVEQTGDANAGGLVGEGEDCTFIDCVNMSAVCGSDKANRIGGICGYSTRCTFEKCFNGGVLAQMKSDMWAITTLVSGYGIQSSIQSIYEIAPSIAKYRNIQAIEVALTNLRSTTSAEALAENLEFLQMTEAVEAFSTIGYYYSIASGLYAAYSLVSTIITLTNDPDEMGGITAKAYGSTFDRCMNAGRIFCLDSKAGGIVGYAGGTTNEIRNCINIGYVKGDEQTGGIVGYTAGGQMSNCLNTATIDCSTKETAGPIYGESAVASPTTNCFAMTYGVDDHTGALSGGSAVTLVSFRDVMSGFVASELNRLSDSHHFLQVVGKQPFPTFFNPTADSTILIDRTIETVFKVADYRDFCNAIFIQYADIELVDDIDFEDQFFSVYRECTPFRGTIDGKGHSFKHIKAKASDAGSLSSGKYALIGVADHATFKNLSFDSCTFKYKQEGAGLVHVSNNSYYENVSLTGGTSMCAFVRSGGLVHTSNKDKFVNCGVGLGCTVTSTPDSYKDNYNTTWPVRQSYVGGIARQAKGSEFTDCYISGKVSGPYGPTGGIVSEAEDCKFTHCVIGKEGVVSTIESPSKCGGIAAYAKKSEFFRCANYGKVETERNSAGAIVGEGEAVTINSCLNNGTLEFTGNFKYGSIIGYATSNSLVVNCADRRNAYPIVGEGKDMKEGSGNNYRLGNTTGGNANEWGMWVSEKDFNNGKACYWLNNGLYDSKDAWHQTDSILHLESDGKAVTISDIVNVENSDVFKISSAADLKAFADEVNSGNQFACAVLLNDILMPKGERWTPIGRNEANKHFRGIFDGQGHTISGLDVEINSDDQGAGLFGTIHSSAIICNVVVDSTCVITNKGKGGAAGIVGRFNTQWYWSEAIIENCANYASVNAFKHAGGILGRVYTGENDGPGVRIFVNNCYNMGTITADDGDSGLLCGYTKDNGYVSNCWSGGKLKMSNPNYQYWPFSTVNDPKNRKIECLVGYNTKHHVVNCYVVDPDVNVDHYNYRTDYALSLQDSVTAIDHKEIVSGRLTRRLNGYTNDVTKSLGWQQELGTDSIPAFGNKGVYHTRTVSNQYGTVCLPYSLKSDDNIRYYYFEESSEADGVVTLNFTYTPTVIPGSPVLFRVAEPGDITFSDALIANIGWADSPVDDVPAAWNFTGTYKQLEFTGDATKTIYYVSNGAIKHSSTKVTVAPFRAYFEGPSIETLTGNGSTPARIRIVIDGEEDETSALELVYENRNENDNDNENRSYTLFGTEAGEGYRGIVVRGGKKVITSNN